MFLQKKEEKETRSTHAEKVPRGTVVQRAVLYFRLRGEVLRWVDRRYHSFNCQECRKVGSVRWDEYQCKEPPNRTNNSSWYRSKFLIFKEKTNKQKNQSYYFIDGVVIFLLPWRNVTALLHESSQCKPGWIQHAEIIRKWISVVAMLSGWISMLAAHV